MGHTASTVMSSEIAFGVDGQEQVAQPAPDFPRLAAIAGEHLAQLAA